MNVMALGALRARARPAGLGDAGMGPEPWSNYPGSGGPMRSYEPPYGDGPQWRTNFITSQPGSLKVFNGGPAYKENPGGSSSGKPIYRAAVSLGMPPQLVRPSVNRSQFTMGLGGPSDNGPLTVEEISEVDLEPCLNRVGGISEVDYLRGRSLWLTVVGTSVAAYHGYHRNTKSPGWAAFGWGLAGFLFPVITVGVALVQGVGKR